MKITITQREGLSDLCDKPFTCDSFAKANEELSRWSKFAPKDGCYNKCDFKVETEERNCDGRYDLKHFSVEKADLKRHILDNLAFLSGRSKPDRMTQERYNSYISDCTPEELNQDWELHQSLSLAD